jgi:DNA-binding IclR family transcriptional regulator
MVKSWWGEELVGAIDTSYPASAFEESALETRYVASLSDTARRISARITPRVGSWPPADCPA